MTGNINTSIIQIPVLKFCSFYVIMHNLELLLRSKMIEVTCNDRLGKKVRVKCKYPLNTWTLYSTRVLNKMRFLNK